MEKIYEVYQKDTNKHIGDIFINEEGIKGKSNNEDFADETYSKRTLSMIMDSMKDSFGRLIVFEKGQKPPYERIIPSKKNTGKVIEVVEKYIKILSKIYVFKEKN